MIAADRIVQRLPTIKQRRALLLAAYSRTTYTAELGDGETLALRIGESNHRLDRLLEAHGTDCWAYVSACNPQSVAQSMDMNAELHRQLVACVDRRGFSWYAGKGEPDEPGWLPEASVLILGIDAQDALVLGRRFQQAAIVCGALGGSARLVWC